MDVSNMMNRLSFRLEDPDKDIFTAVFMLSALNRAQNKLPQFLHNDYLVDLQYSKTSLTVTAGVTASLAAASLGYDLLRSGQGIIKVKDSTTGTYLTQIGLTDLKRLENRYLKPSIQSPVFYIAANKIYVLPATGIGTIDVFLLRLPATMYYTYTASGGGVTTILSTDTNLSTTADTYNRLIIYNETQDKYFKVNDFSYASPTFTFTVDTAGAAAGVASDIFYFVSENADSLNVPGTVCELNPCLHNIILRMAEAECWSLDRRLDRRFAALDAAFKEIQVLNRRYGVADGIGPSAFKRFMATAK